jgi:prolyl-tRNA synthetase
METAESRILAELKKKGIKFEVKEHIKVHDCAGMAGIVGIPQQAIAKSLVFRAVDGDYVLAVAPGNKSISKRNVSETAGSGRVELAKPEQVKDMAGCETGCVYPFGTLMHGAVKTIVDRDLLKNREIYFNPGTHTKTVKISARDYMAFEKPKEFVTDEKRKGPACDPPGIGVKKSDDFSAWFDELVAKCGLADTRYNVKGFPVYRPWAAWSIKKMQRLMEGMLEKNGHMPLLMPAVIPESNFRSESEHVEGFTPEVFWVTEHGAGEKFEERLALRPTSETAFYQMFALWLRSHKDLPLKTYQSDPVWRCEGKATRPFFRTRQLHWIEAHDVFATKEDAERQVMEDMETTKKFIYGECAMPFIFFQRPEWDKFAGAVHTYAADALMPSGRVMQLPSTHLLGQGFSKAFNVKFMDSDEQEKFVWITCYGPCASRNYGAMVALHSDDKGLVMPFALAPFHAVIVPILFGKEDKAVMEKCAGIKSRLEKVGYSVLFDDDQATTAGWKFNHWEMMGVPVRIETGPRDLKAGKLVVYRRDTEKKETINDNELEDAVKKIAAEYTNNLRERAEEQFKGNTVHAHSVEEARKAIKEGMLVKADFCSIDKNGEECAAVVEKELAAFVRGRRLDETEKPKGKCIFCGKPAREIVYIAKSY